MHSFNRVGGAPQGETGGRLASESRPAVITCVDEWDSTLEAGTAMSIVETLNSSCVSKLWTVSVYVIINTYKCNILIQI